MLIYLIPTSEIQATLINAIQKFPKGDQQKYFYYSTGGGAFKYQSFIEVITNSEFT